MTGSTPCDSIGGVQDFLTAYLATIDRDRRILAIAWAAYIRNRRQPKIVTEWAAAQHSAGLHKHGAYLHWLPECGPDCCPDEPLWSRLEKRTAAS